MLTRQFAIIGALLVAAPVAGQIRGIRAVAPLAAQPVSISLLSFPSAVEDVPYDTQTVTVTGGTGPYTCTVSVGSLPPGITETSECVYGGTPTTPGTYTFTIRATDSLGATGSRIYAPTITMASPMGPLPDGWSHTDIGTGQDIGDATYADVNSDSTLSATDTFTLTGAGTVYNASDKLHFAYQSVTGDYEVVARVSSCTNESGLTGYQQCGPMTRVSLAANSANFYCFSNTNYPIVQWRTTNGGSTDSDAFTSSRAWYRLKVVSNSATCEYSIDGTVWTQLGTAKSLPASGSYYIGLAVNSNFDADTVTGVFDNIAVAVVPGGTMTGGTDYGGYRPHYQGAGYDSNGGRGGETRICTVNTLTMSGSTTWGSTGNFSQCFAGVPPGCDINSPTISTCASYVLFSVSGTIDLGGREIYMGHPWITVAGQAAPLNSEGSCSANCSSPGGIQFINGTIKFVYSHSVTQHIRVRAGSGYSFHSIYIGDPFPPFSSIAFDHTVLDHASVEWGGGAGFSNLGIYSSATDVLITDSIVSEAQNTNGEGGLNLLWSGAGSGLVGCDGAMVRVLMSTSWGRMPWIGPGCQVSNVNSLVYNASANGPDNGGFSQAISADGCFGFDPYRFDYTAVRNVYLAGRNSSHPVGFLTVAIGPYQASLGNTIYLEGNSDDFGSITGPTGDGQWTGVYFGNAGFLPTTTATCGHAIDSAGSQGNTRIDSPLSYYTDSDFHLLATADVASYLRTNAGAFPVQRDAADTRIVADTTEGPTGDANVFYGPISAVGGYPTIAERSWTLSIPASPGAVDTGHTGFSNGVRTKLEYYLETLARRAEVAQGVP